MTSSPIVLNKYSYSFPNPRFVDSEIVAIGGDLNPNRLLYAYRSGIFPWYNEDDPILWWCPNRRMVLYPDELKMSKSLKKSIKKFDFKINSNFKQVIQSCQEVRKKEGTWLNDDMIEAYIKLFDMGFAYSIETYFENNLVGGLYGVKIGKIFCGESMFYKKTDASKAAMFHLCSKKDELDFDIIDCQVPNNHLKKLGGIEINKYEFLDILSNCI